MLWMVPVTLADPLPPPPELELQATTAVAVHNPVATDAQ
jgi:hypothetical protein